MGTGTPMPGGQAMWRTVPGRLRAAATVGALAPAVFAAAALTGSPAHADPGPPQAVIVRYPAAGPAAAQQAVLRAGGAVGRLLAVADSFTARVPVSRLASVASAAGVQAVTLDEQVRLN